MAVVGDRSRYGGDRTTRSRRNRFADPWKDTSGEPPVRGSHLRVGKPALVALNGKQVDATSRLHALDEIGRDILGAPADRLRHGRREFGKVGWFFPRTIDDADQIWRSM